jgi:DNA-directed RNA polymerase specialized sigma24 family protein
MEPPDQDPLDLLDQEMTEFNTTTIIIHRFAAGDDHALTEYLSRHKAKFVRLATRTIRHLGIDEADLDGEGAVDLAFTELCEKKRRGALASVNSSQDFAKMLTRILDRVINDQRRRAQASKRGGNGAAARPGNGAGAGKGRADRFTRTYADLDAFLSPLPPVEELIIAVSELEYLLKRVGNPILVRIVKLRYEGFTRKAIAKDLDVTERTVQQKLAIIREIHSQLFPNRSR